MTLQTSRAETGAARAVRPRRHLDRGFSLLEVMVALAIMAIALAAVTSASSSSVVNSARVYRMTTAAMLIRGVVLDIEEEYQAEGFPSNDLSSRDCDLPRPFDREFECEYSLEGMEFDEAELQTMATQAISGLMGGTDPTQLAADFKKGGGAPAEMLGRLSSLLPALAAFGGVGQAEKILDLCGINPLGIASTLQGVAMFFPMIVKTAADSTRKLTVTLTWKEGRRESRELKIETFIVVIPEELDKQMKGLGRAEEMGLLPGGGAAGGGHGGAGGAGGAGGGGRGGPGGGGGGQGGGGR